MCGFIDRMAANTGLAAASEYANVNDSLKELFEKGWIETLSDNG